MEQYYYDYDIGDYRPRRDRWRHLPEAEQQVLDKSRECLDDFLTDKQKLDRHHYGHFDVVSNKGRTWRIYTTRGTTQNVRCLDGWPSWIASYYCAHVHDLDFLDFEQTWIAQLLLIKTNERAFRKVAHRWS